MSLYRFLLLRSFVVWVWKCDLFLFFPFILRHFVELSSEFLQAIVNGNTIYIPETIAPNGLLQKNLNELVAALGDEATEEAIAQFNKILKKDLEVSWEL